MEGARKDGGWEGGSKGRMGEGERDRGEGGSDDTVYDDARQWRKRGLWEGGLMKGRNEAWTARGKDGREEASGGAIERGREGARGAREGRKLQGRYPEEGTGQCTVYSQTIPQRGPWP